MKNNVTTRIIKAIFFGIGGAAISKAILMIFNLIIARLVDETSYGVFSIINNTVQTFTVFAGAGLGVSASRTIALYREKNEELTGIIIKTLIVFTCILSLFVSMIMFIYSKKISLILSSNVDISNYLRLTSLTIFCTSVVLILQSVLQGFEEFKKIAFVQVIINSFNLIIGFFCTYYFRILGAVTSLLVLQLLLLLAYWFIIKRIIKKKHIKLKFKITKEVKSCIINVAIPAFLSSIFVIPIIWFTNFKFTNLNGYEEFAAFSVCLQWFTILNYLPQQLGQVKPIYTQLYSNGDFNRLKQIILKMMRFSILFSLLIALILMFFSGLILSTYGKFYVEYRLPFVIMLIASVFYAIQSQYGNFFHAIGKIWASLFLNIIWAISFVICFFIFYKKGVLGYSIAYLISYFIYGIISTVYFIKIINRKKELK